ncbi:hypothetical protein [Paractinoplanes globisporus]|uniref:Uncharacterized protein n=1 Tax=Paractinoplanes globisporus TaxID=113565 RepID=A0ABW6WHS1_9ACTN|nr:hypothetical protein [Actinoplanes globisporus]
MISIGGHGPWFLPGDAPITIVCSELPPRLQDQLPIAPSDPDRSLGLIGGIDWNTVAQDDADPSRGYFEVIGETASRES